MTDLFPPTLEPRPYQHRIVGKTIELLEGGVVHSVLVESPTGSGKSVMGLTVARHFQAQGLSVGWCAMRRNLLAQVKAENAAKGFGVDLKLISMFDKEPPKVDLLVIDEAQHDGALSMATLHGKIRPKLILGLSATPYRTDRVKLCFEKVLKDAGIHALIQDGYLSRFRHFTIPKYDPAAVAEFYARERDRWGRSILFFHTMEQCRACVGRLAELGVGCELVTATTDREAQLERFDAGGIPVLVSMQILAEGFDCPSLATVFVRPSGKGCTIQMAGRVLRKFPGIEFKQIVQCAQTRWPFPRTATPAEAFQWVEDPAPGQWRSLGNNGVIDKMAAKMILALRDAKPSGIHKLILTKREGARPRRRRHQAQAQRPQPLPGLDQRRHG